MNPMGFQPVDGILKYPKEFHLVKFQSSPSQDHLNSFFRFLYDDQTKVHLESQPVSVLHIPENKISIHNKIRSDST